MNKFYLLKVFFVCFLSSYAQAPAIQWQKTLGGANMDNITEIIQTPDGGYIAAGSTSSSDGDLTSNNSSGNGWVIKMNNTGVVQWQRTYGGLGSEGFSNVVPTSDGGYFLVGTTNSTDGIFSTNHGERDAWVVKLDGAGEIVWQSILGGPKTEYVYDIKPTADGGCIFVGAKEVIHTSGWTGWKDYWIVKLNSAGTIQWQRTYGGTTDEYAQSVFQTTDNGYIVTGYAQSDDGDVLGNHGDMDIWVMKLDTSGAIVWQKALGGTGGDFGWDVSQTTDGGYIIVGDTSSNDGDVIGRLHGVYDIWVVKLDATGNIVWQKTYGGSGGEYPTGIAQTTDNGYIISGVSHSTNDGDITNNHGLDDFWILKLNENGILQWQKSFGGSDNDYPFNIQQTLDGGYVVSGFTASNNGDVTGYHGNVDGWVIKLGAGGNNLPVQPQFASLQQPVSGTMGINTNFMVSGQVFVAGLTDVVPNISGQAPGIRAWVGLSPVGQNTNPASWSNWIPATHDGTYVGNNDEYFANVSTGISGTYYYATRYLLDDGCYVYGGINGFGTGNLWDGVNYKSGVLTVTEPAVPLQGVYNVLVEKLNTTGGPYYFTNETVTNTGLNQYRTTNIANYYPQGGTPGSTGTIALTGGQPGYTFKRVGYNILVEDQMLFDYYGIQIYQSTEQFNVSTYDATTGVIKIEYTIMFSDAPREYRSTYNPLPLGTNQAIANSLSFYPNPVKDVLFVSGIESDFCYKIYNFIGQEVGSGDVRSDQNQINMANLVKGNYIVRIISGSKIKNIKVIKD